MYVASASKNPLENVNRKIRHPHEVKHCQSKGDSISNVPMGGPEEDINRDQDQKLPYRHGFLNCGGV